ncbi:MAG TPA: multiheme c-type cytochrome [Burkholderiales bacterium]|nr:multiheme c-type cytochrome [Burkholderiales bacterium]
MTRTMLGWLAVALLALLGAVTAGCVTGPGGPTADGFVGSEACQKCHQAEYRTWKDTYHSKMIRTLKDGLLKGAGDNWAKDAKGTAGPTRGNIDGKPYKLEDVQLVVGSFWKQRYLVKNPATGNLQFMDKQWNTVHKQWENYGQKNDWETQCATCHATGYRLLSYDPENPAAQKVAMSEHNTGCEACHGPGAKHVQSARGADVFNPGKASKEQASLVCGYCHVRKENEHFKTAQGNPREDQPHPVVGQTFKAGQDDWRKWYPDKMLIPGVNPAQPVNQNYPKTDLNNAFWLDEQSQKSGLYDARKHHQEYQEFIQSKHYRDKENPLSCSDCHSSHAVAGKALIESRATCRECHRSKYDVDKIMPGTASTAQNLFVATHTFNPNQARKATPRATSAPEYFYKK